MFGEIDAALSIWERLTRWIRPESLVSELNSVASRFVMLFEKHGMHRNQIPRFFEHVFTLDHVASDEKLLAYLTPEILKTTAELFAIRLQWLEGADNQIYETHDFYKRPEEYGEFLKRFNSEDDQSIRVKLVLSVTPESRKKRFNRRRRRFRRAG